MTSKAIRRARRRGYLGPWEQMKAGICLNCGERGPHFVPPSFGDPGFYFCTKKEADTEPLRAEGTAHSGRTESNDE